MIKTKKPTSNIANIEVEKKRIAVVSTMSSGKSTLINALLGSDILPTENQACTGVIFRIENSLKKNDEKISIHKKDGTILVEFKKS